MKIHFLGAARQVTGSCHLLEIGRYKILLDCGLIQGNYLEEKRNVEDFPFDLEQLDAVILSHAHLDHSGRLPLLVKRGYNGKIYTQQACRDLCTIMLRDAAYLNERDAEWENRKRERKGLPLLQPLYTQIDATAAMAQFEPLAYQQAYEILPGIKLRLHDAGHILGAAIVELQIDIAGQERRLIFSGDLGQGQSPILKTPTPLSQADLVIMESTYGDRNHRAYEATLTEFEDVLQQAHAAQGNIIIPAFAVGRSQELLYLFAKHYQDWRLDRWHIFLDSPMAIEATKVYMQYAELYQPAAREFWQSEMLQEFLPKLRFCNTPQESIALNNIRSGALIISASGMCSGGRVKHHLKHNVWRRNCHIIITGFQAKGTPGRALVDGAAHLRLWGETIKVSAQVHTLGGFSAHADQQALCNWYANFKPGTPLALVHGEEKAMQTLAAKLHTDFAINPLTPKIGEQINL